MVVIGVSLQIIGWWLAATPVWYALLMEILFRYGVGYRTRGKLRRMRMPEWLSVAGIGIFLAPFIIVLGRTLHATGIS